MPTFDELSKKLSDNLKDVESKKKVLDSSHAAFTKASQDYQLALEAGTSIKKDMVDLLNQSYPTEIKPKIG